MGQKLVRRSLTFGAPLRHSAFAALLLLACVHGTSRASGVLAIDVGEPLTGTAVEARVEVVRTGTEGPAVWKGTAGPARAGVELPAGRYRVYVEEQRTGFILAWPESSRGIEVFEGKTGAAKIELRKAVEELEARAREERERSSRSGRTAGASVPGELLIRFSPDAGLAARHAFLEKLGAEPREKVSGLDLYQVRVPEGADLDRLIAVYGKDPRVLYVEKNQVVSVPKAPKAAE